MLKPNYPEYNVANRNENCGVLIKEAETEMYKLVALGVRRKILYNQHTPCIMAKLRAEGWMDQLFLELIYRQSQTMPDEEKKRKVNEIHEKVMNTTEDAITVCVYEDFFGQVYDKISNDPITVNSTEGERIDNYCARKYVVEKKLIDTKVHKVDLNPTNVQVDDVECEILLEIRVEELAVIMTALMNDSHLELNEFQIKCAAKKIRDGKFTDKILAAVIMSELELTDQQRKQERKKFIKTMENLLKTLEVCDH